MRHVTSAKEKSLHTGVREVPLKGEVSLSVDSSRSSCPTSAVPQSGLTGALTGVFHKIVKWGPQLSNGCIVTAYNIKTLNYLTCFSLKDEYGIKVPRKAKDMRIRFVCPMSMHDNFEKRMT